MSTISKIINFKKIRRKRKGSDLHSRVMAMLLLKVCFNKKDSRTISGGGSASLHGLKDGAPPFLCCDLYRP